LPPTAAIVALGGVRGPRSRGVGATVGKAEHNHAVLVRGDIIKVEQVAAYIAAAAIPDAASRVMAIYAG
jgi:hypothetical protein